MARKGSSAASARSRLKLNERFLQEFLESWEQNGKDAIKLLFQEEPAKYVYLAASLLPKEIDVTHTENVLHDISDERLDAILATVRSRIAGSFAEAGSREIKTIDGEQTKLLSAVSEATRILHRRRDLPRAPADGSESIGEDAS